MQKGFVPILIVILIAALVGGYFVYTNSQTKTPTPSAQPSPSPSDETANWKTYMSTQMGYQIKYPPNLKYITRIDKAVGKGEVNVDEWSAPDEAYTISIHSYQEGVEPITRLLTDTELEQTALVAGQIAKKLIAKYQPLIHIGPVKNKSQNYLIIFMASSSNKNVKSDIDTFNQMLSTFRFE